MKLTDDEQCVWLSFVTSLVLSVTSRGIAERICPSQEVIVRGAMAIADQVIEGLRERTGD